MISRPDRPCGHKVSGPRVMSMLLEPAIIGAFSAKGHDFGVMRDGGTDMLLSAAHFADIL